MEGPRPPYDVVGFSDGSASLLRPVNTIANSSVAHRLAGSAVNLELPSALPSCVLHA